MHSLHAVQTPHQHVAMGLMLPRDWSRGHGAEAGVGVFGGDAGLIRNGWPHPDPIGTLERGVERRHAVVIARSRYCLRVRSGTFDMCARIGCGCACGWVCR